MFSRFYFLILLFLLNSQMAYSQQGSRTISGLVTTEDSAPLEGVAVSIKGTNNVSGSQADGIFYLSINKKDSILVFSHAECQTVEIKLNASNEYNVVMSKKQLAADAEKYLSSAYILERSFKPRPGIAVHIGKQYPSIE